MYAAGVKLVKGAYVELNFVEDPKNGFRAVVLTGEGRGFCSGADTSSPRGLADGPEPPAGKDPSIVDRVHNVRAIQRVARAVQQLEKPLLAAVNG